MNLKILSYFFFVGVVLLTTFSSLFAEEKKIPLNASERILLEQSRIQVPSHYIEAHDFEGEMASGNKASLADFSGKFLILNFWATWCGPCRAEMASLDSLQTVLGPDALTVFAVNQEEEPAEIRAYLEEGGYQAFRVLKDRFGNASALYGVESLPTTFIIDREGVIREHWVGARPASVFEAALRELGSVTPAPPN